MVMMNGGRDVDGYSGYSGPGYRDGELRGSVLDEAREIINGARQDVYGNPEDSFLLIAEYWTAYLRKKFGEEFDLERLSPKDIALMMALFKIAREQHQGKRDNLIDAAGYIGIAGDMYKK